MIASTRLATRSTVVLASTTTTVKTKKMSIFDLPGVQINTTVLMYSIQYTLLSFLLLPLPCTRSRVGYTGTFVSYYLR